MVLDSSRRAANALLRALALTIAFCMVAAAAVAPTAKEGRPRLVVVVVVDQMRADYLVRFAGLFEGGFRRYLQRGAVFTDGHHDHGYTVTAAGHATVSTGTVPAHSGIVGNEWYDREAKTKAYATGDPASPIVGAPSSGGQSPRNLRRTAFGDWLKAASPKSKVFSVAFKDRSSILMGGQHPDAAYWYGGSTGRFVSSTYYMKAYPAWVDAFNASGLVDTHFAEGWHKLLPEDAYFASTEDRIATENDGEHTTFPYTFDDGTPTAKTKYYDRIWGTPFGDELAIEFAKALVVNERLGEDADTDILWLSCSTADSVGHRFGPLSQEAQDCYMRLDRKLGELFDFLDARVGVGNYVLALSADHGVLPLPEELQRRGIDSMRVPGAEQKAQVTAAVAEVARATNAPDGLLVDVDYEGVILNLPADGRLTPAEMRRRVAERLRQLPFVADAYTLEEIGGTGSGRPYLDAYRRSFFVGRSPDVVLRYRENYLVDGGTRGTSHGSPYAYDTHVPIVFVGRGIAPGLYGGRVRTIDIAPTLATLIGVPVPSDVDGQSLREKFRVRDEPDPD